MISVVIPVHNEEEVLEGALAGLLAGLETLGESFEVLPIENGSRDRTWEICERLAGSDSRIRPIRSPVADYGAALKLGLLEARGDRILSDEIDVLSHEFHRDGLAALDSADLVIASKRHPAAQDRRGFYRRAGTWVITMMLRAACGLKATDTHGLKAWRRDTARLLASECVLQGDLFASEAVLRAERKRLRIVELPLSLDEIRGTPIPLSRRIPRVMKDIRQLRRALRS